jgi:hypothetical protein
MLLDDFAVDLMMISWWTQHKSNLAAWRVFHPFPDIRQGLKGIFTFSRMKKGVSRLNTSF